MKKYSVKEDIFFDTNSEGVFILAPDGNTIILRDEVALILWNELTKNNSITFDKLENSIKLNFDLSNVNQNQMQNDILSFISELRDLKIIVERNV